MNQLQMHIKIMTQRQSGPCGKVILLTIKNTCIPVNKLIKRLRDQQEIHVRDYEKKIILPQFV